MYTHTHLLLLCFRHKAVQATGVYILSGTTPVRVCLAEPPVHGEPLLAIHCSTEAILLHNSSHPPMPLPHMVYRPSLRLANKTHPVSWHLRCTNFSGTPSLPFVLPILLLHFHVLVEVHQWIYCQTSPVTPILSYLPPIIQ